ncbi:MAG: UDP-N-acetylmuramoyl-tripeptide--D-alanyl-D-alanine ligase, partial [Clostridiales bacterium]|nr:UDP-N-acetylmuramoyl-tripeptide--D-alanyl-D-alanine ligase [Clostridiales bacterium]
MRGMTISRAAAVCGGRICGEGDLGAELGSVVIDSRAVSAGDFFVAYKGERVDGHDYISAAFDRGAVCCLAQRVPEGETRPVILVPDVQTALEQICAEYRRDLRLPVIGITGSVGKTSAKEMISAVLSQRLNVLKTDKNLNNQIGVPMTISRIRPEHQAAVVEMGISGFGEMSVLARIARPDMAVFTLIGHAHLEFLHDLDGVLRAKTEMLDFMADDAPVLINGDDEKLRGLQCRQKKISFGLGENCDIRAENIRLGESGETFCDIVYGERRIPVEIRAYGRHMIYAALEGAAVGLLMGLSDGEIVRGVASFETVGRRAAVCDTGFITLIDDSYNANPDSVKCGIDSLMKMPGRHVCILGDMLELGEGSGEMHFDVGRYAGEKGAE